jgi:hypothetical protein
MQKLMESGVTEEELPQYLDVNSPVGVQQFDPKKVAAKLGTEKAQEKAEARASKENAPKKEVNLDLQQAYGELNDLLLSGVVETDSARAKVAGLRERYKSVYGEEPEEVFPQPSNKEQYDRLPSGISYIGKDGKIKIKK